MLIFLEVRASVRFFQKEFNPLFAKTREIVHDLFPRFIRHIKRLLHLMMRKRGKREVVSHHFVSVKNHGPVSSSLLRHPRRGPVGVDDVAASLCVAVPMRVDEGHTSELDSIVKRAFL